MLTCYLLFFPTFRSSRMPCTAKVKGPAPLIILGSFETQNSNTFAISDLIRSASLVSLALSSPDVSSALIALRRYLVIFGIQLAVFGVQFLSPFGGVTLSSFSSWVSSLIWRWFRSMGWRSDSDNYLDGGTEGPASSSSSYKLGFRSTSLEYSLPDCPPLESPLSVRPLSCWSV